MGASIDCTPAQLVSFAHLGVRYRKDFLRLERCPNVALLNIGSESVKGTKVHRKAFQKLQEAAEDEFHFIGNIEGRSIFQGDADIVVTEGFTGNVLLKTIEGATQYILDILTKKGLSSSELKSVLSPIEHPAALLAGVRGLVFKCHGDASPLAMAQAVRRALDHKFTQGFFQS